MNQSNNQSITIYTDGACRGNPGVGGWGVLLINQGIEQTLNGAEADTTNNRMELTAVIQALQHIEPSINIEMYTDSKYVMQGLTEWMPNWKRRGWKTASKKAVKNQDLWQQLDGLAQQRHIDWNWVKGHSGVPGNEAADELANIAIDEWLAEQQEG